MQSQENQMWTIYFEDLPSNYIHSRFSSRTLHSPSFILFLGADVFPVVPYSVILLRRDHELPKVYSLFQAWCGSEYSSA